MTDGHHVMEQGIGPTVDLRAFSPFESVDEESVCRIRREARLREYSRSDVLFREGEKNQEVLYVLVGVVELQSERRSPITITAGTADANRPLSKISPYPCSARVLSRHALIMAIDAEWLEQSGLYKVTDLRDAPDQGDSEDWMAQVLRSAVVGQIPSINVQAMLMRLTRQDVRAGDVIVRQGDIGDYFYIVARGRCAVTRDMPVGSKKLILAELEVGDCFGEEALISGGRRSASVSMLTDGTLMRLGEDDFRKLCCEPLIRSLTLDQARGLAKAGGRWLDVRHPSEITIKSIQGSLAVPLCFLRRRMDGLPRVPLIAVCNTGKSSAVAAFLLAQSGFDVSILEGGLSATTPAVV